MVFLKSASDLAWISFDPMACISILNILAMAGLPSPFAPWHCWHFASNMALPSGAPAKANPQVAANINTVVFIFLLLTSFGWFEITRTVCLQPADHEKDRDDRDGDKKHRDSQPKAAAVLLMESRLSGAQRFVRDRHSRLDRLLHLHGLERAHRQTSLHQILAPVGEPHLRLGNFHAVPVGL